MFTKNLRCTDNPKKKKMSEAKKADSIVVTLESNESEQVRKATWKDLGAVITAGCAFMSDGYMQGVMTMANPTLLASFSEYDSNWKSMISNAILVANIIGQLSFGIFADRIGRKQAFMYTTGLIIVGAILCAAANGKTPQGLFWMLIVGRGVAGVGVGGEYSNSAPASIEIANERLRKKNRTIPFILSTNLPVALGVPVATIVFLIVQAIWGNNHLNGIWRTCFGIGAVIPLSIFYFRTKMEHAKSFKDNAMKRKVPYLLIIKKYYREILGTSLMWFFMDMILYPNNIFSTSILGVAIPNATLRRTGEWQLFLSSFAILGVVIGIIATKFFSRRFIIISGFLAYGVVSFIVGGAFEKFEKIPALLIIFYALLNCIINYGPANLQSLVSSESFPTAVRATFYGLGAAVGKAGAAIGTQIFTPIQVHAGKRYTFFLSGGLSVLGAIIVYWGVPDYGDRDLEFLDEELKVYLKENNWEGDD